MGWEYTGDELRRRYWVTVDRGQEDNSQDLLLLSNVTDPRFASMISETGGMNGLMKLEGQYDTGYAPSIFPYRWVLRSLSMNVLESCKNLSRFLILTTTLPRVW